MENEKALRNASRDGDNLMVKKLLSEGVVHQTPNENGDTPLILATSCYITEPKYVNVVRALLEGGDAKINHQNHDGNAAIHNASSSGFLEIVELLLNKGADVELEGEMMMTPLGIAATKKHHAVVNMLVKKLVDEQKFSRKQVEWMHNAENPMQQVHVYRSLVSIFQQKAALKSLIQYDVIAAIMRGIKRFNKASVQSSGLQLLIQCLELEEGVAVAKETNLKRDVMDACREFMGDAVISHLVNNVTGVL